MTLLKAPAWLLLGLPGVMLTWFLRPHRGLSEAEREDLRKQEESLLLYDRLAREAGVKLVSKVKLFSHVANIGDVRSLIIHPASTTHRQVPKDKLKDAGAAPETAPPGGGFGAAPDVVRLSVGLEDKADIIADLEQALGQI